LQEKQFSAKIKKLNSDNKGEFVKKWITAFLAMMGIIHELSHHTHIKATVYLSE
jgi:hypothetical protein